MNEKQPSEPRGLSRRAFVQGTALAGFAAFLAACTGTKASSAPSATAAASASEAAGVDRPVRGPHGRPDLHPDAAEHHRAAQVRQLARLHRPGDRRRRHQRRPARRVVQDARGLQEEVQRQGRLRREDRRQPGVLRDDPAGPGRQPADRLGPDGPDRLDGRQDHHQGLGRATRPGQPPELRQEPARPAAWPDVGSDQRLPLPVAVRDDRDRLQHEDPRREQHRRSRPSCPTCGTSRPTR